MRNGFSLGIKPELSLYGTGGTYFLNDRDRWTLLVFKPEDEEPFAENNPRINWFYVLLLGDFQGVTGHSGFRKGVRSGEGWKREVAAFLLDRDNLFSVPTTVQVFFLSNSSQAGTYSTSLLPSTNTQSKDQSWFAPTLYSGCRSRERLVALQVLNVWSKTGKPRWWIGSKNRVSGHVYYEFGPQRCEYSSQAKAE